MKSPKPLLVTFLTASCLLVLVVFYSRQQIALMETYARSEVSHLTESSADQIKLTVRYAKSSIRGVAVSLGTKMTDDTLADADDQLAPLVQNTPFSDIEFIRPDGMYISGTDKVCDGSEFVSYKEGIKGKTGIWTEFSPEDGAEPVFHFYTPLCRGTRIVGVLSGQISASTQFNPLLTSTFFEEQTIAFLMNLDGKVITSTAYSLNGMKTLEEFLSTDEHDFAHKSDLQSLLSGPTQGAVPFTADSGKGYCCVMTIPDTEWYVALIVPPESLKNIILRNNRSVVLSFFLAIIVFMLYMLYLVLRKRHQNRLIQKENRQLELENQEFNEKNKQAFLKLNMLNKQLEESRIKAEAANNAKTVFLNNMSHDIRTPMNAILGYTQLMKEKVDSPEKIRDYLGKIEKSGEYLLELINNVLDVSRIDSGKIQVDEEFIDLLSPDNNVAPLLENEIQKKGLHFTNDITIQDRYVFADMRMIRQINMNLMSNAIKYTPEGGHIHLHFEQLTPAKDGYATYVNVISDDGIGMSKDFQKTLFDSFTREKTTTESKVIGSGLGMAIVKKLVDLMDGRLEVESEPGKGTTFSLYMNHRIVENPEEYLSKQKEAVKEEVSFNGKRVLLTEDNELNAEISTEILSLAGITVEHAEDGVICLDMLRNAEPGYYDAILMDIQMPNLDGYQTTHKIRSFSDPIKACIPIIAMTANAFDEDRKRAIDAGMNGHIAKPIDMKQLFQVLGTVLR